MKIYTITLNPAYDVHATAADFAAGHENLATVTSREAGGKGVNISRALQANGIENTALVVLGTDNAAEFRQELKDAGIETCYLERPGRIRENLTLHTPGQPETRISFAGFPQDNTVLQEVLAALQIDGDTYVTFTGRIPSGMSVEKAKAFLLELKNRGAKLVLDSKSLTVDDILEIGPWLIKPNQEEISAYLQEPVSGMWDAVEATKIFENRVENIMVSMGQQGAILVTGEYVYAVEPPKIQAVSTIGAGDSTIAGFLAASAMEESAPQRLKRAVAFGTAACLTGGTLPPKPEDVEIVYQRTERIL